MFKHVYLVSKLEAYINIDDVSSIVDLIANEYEQKKYGAVCAVNMSNGDCFRSVGDAEGMHEYFYANGGQPCY